MGINSTKTIGEAIAFLLAIVLKGPVGLGMIVVVLCLGLRFFYQLLHKLKMPHSLMLRNSEGSHG